MTWEWIIIVLYGLSLLFIFLFSLGQLHLAYHYLRAKKKQAVVETPDMIGEYPKACVQLPIYNEKYVVNRLVDAVCQLDYPKEALEIQLLDDSTDETTQMLEAKVQHWKYEGINIKLIQRPQRIDFKAGALQYGMERTDA